MAKKISKKKRQKAAYKKKLKASAAKLKGTVGKKEIKKLEKEIRKSSIIPALEDVRCECNHHLKKESAVKPIAEIAADDKIRFVKRLDSSKAAIGEENVGVCSICLSAVPAAGVITAEKLDNAASIMMLAIETIKTSKKLDKKERKMLYKLTRDLDDQRDYLVSRLKKIEAKREKRAALSVNGSAKNFSIGSGKRNYSEQD